ncbi:MAG: CvpA family protein [Bacilli bacterium]
MIDILMYGVLLIGLFYGWKHGLLQQLLDATIVILSVFGSIYWGSTLATKIQAEWPQLLAWVGEFVPPLFIPWLYKVGTVLLLFVFFRFGLGLVRKGLSVVDYIPVINFVNSFLGAILGLFKAYLLVFTLLLLASVVMAPQMQEWSKNSTLYHYIVYETPVLSEWTAFLHK